MAGMISLATIMSRMVKVTCPYCRHAKMVTRDPVAYRVCPHCHKQFPNPHATSAKRRSSSR